MNIITKSIDLGDGRKITIETGKLAKQAAGSVVVRLDDTMLLATVVCADKAKDGVDFMPLTVEYKEKFASAGRYPGGFLKREGRPGDHEILNARLIDRALRPLFPKDFHQDTFVTVEVISFDRANETMPDAMACLAASAALAVSNVPFAGPVSEARVARINGEFVINPGRTQLEEADIDLVVAATEENIMMVEGEMSEVSEDEMIEAMSFAHEAIKVQCAVQKELTIETGNEIKKDYVAEDIDEVLEAKIATFASERIYETAKAGLAKHERSAAFSAIKADFEESLSEEEKENFCEDLISKYFHDTEKDTIRKMMLAEKTRLDGRKLDEIRPIWSEIDYLPGAHGSAVFTRGETQSLTTVTLGTKLDEKLIDTPSFRGKERFLLHYNFPPYSTGDARPQRGTSRREIGHGNLAWRALKGMMPDREDNPYTVRVVSDILESNGSSSMATVCAGTLALMDCGVKIKKPVSGIAMGLVTNKAGEYVVLSDILGDEDHLGDMDFKVTGTEDGITACQMDIKVDGLSVEILTKALMQAKAGRLHILGKMMETMPEVRTELKSHVPGMVTVMIPKEMIGAIIGPGGKVIQDIQATTETTISIDEIDDQGEVVISGPNQIAIDAALARINAITAIPEEGKIYKGKIKSIVAFGAFVEIMPGKEGLLHISEIEHRRLKTVDEVLKEGEEVEVKLIGVDKRTGKMKLSRKALLPKPERK